MRKVIWLQTPPNILARCKKHFFQPLNVHGFNVVRQTEVNTAELLEIEPSASEAEMAIEKLKIHKSPGIVQIPAELNKAGGRIIRSEIHKLIISISNKEELPDEWKESVIVPIYKKVIKEIVVIIKAFHFVNYIQNSIQHSCVKVNSICRGNYWGSSVWIST
jgi:hypothetical protein